MKVYDQYCAMARGLEIVGERWTLLIVRELLTGPRRWSELRDGLPGVATNMLADRLRDLEERGVVTRSADPEDGRSTVYDLTQWGRGLESVLVALGRWAAPLLGPPRPHDDFRLHWLVLTLRAAADTDALVDVHRTWEFRVDGEVVHVVARDGAIQTAQGPAPAPDVVLSADRQTFLAWGTGHLDDRAALAAGLDVTGDRAGLEELRRAFPVREAPVDA